MDIRTSMRAVRIEQPGPNGTLELAEFPTPAPGPGEVLIRVAAAGVNRADVMQRHGTYPMPPGVSAEIPGLEVSGTVVSIGAGVTRWKAGEQVCALLIGGGYAEYAVAPEGQCLPIPSGVSLVDAAALPEAFSTVWANLIERGKMQAGETVLIQGGTSGIGVTAIMLAKAFGAKVITTAGSEEKCEVCRQLGADLAINYRTTDFHDAAMAFTDGRGVDLIIDIVGGDYIPRELDLLKREGRLVFVALQSGSVVEVDFFKVLLKHLYVTGSTLRSRTVGEKTAICSELERRVWPLFGTHVKPVVHRSFTIAEASAAHHMLEESTHIGKLLILP